MFSAAHLPQPRLRLTPLQRLLAFLVVISLLLQPLLQLAPQLAPAPRKATVTTPRAAAATTATTTTVTSAPVASTVASNVTSTVMPAGPQLLAQPELVNLREEYARHYDLGDGRYVAIASLAPLNYRDAAGQWQPIQSAFAAVTGGWRIEHNSLRSSFGAHTNALHLESSGLAFGWIPQALNQRRADGRATAIARPRNNETTSGQVTGKGQQLSYTNAWDDASLRERFDSRAGALEQSLILAQPPQRLDTSADDGAWLELSAHLVVPVGVALYADQQMQAADFTTTGAIELRNAQGERVLEFASVFAYEEANRAIAIAGRYQVVRTGSAIELRVQTPLAWWHDPNRHYPAVLDPTMQVVKSTAMATLSWGQTYENAVDGAPTAAPWSNLPIWKNQACVGNTVTIQNADYVSRIFHRGYVRFPLPTLPQGVAAPVNALVVAAADPNSGTEPAMQYFSDHIARQPSYLYAMSTDWVTPLLNSNANEIAVGATPNLGLVQQLAFLHKPAASASDPARLPVTGWSATESVQAWYANPASNYGFGLVLYHEGYHQFETSWDNAELSDALPRKHPSRPTGMCFPGTAQWSNLSNVAEHLTDPHNATVDGPGLGLLIVYLAPALPENTMQSHKVPSINPTGAYLNQFHEYQLPKTANRWQLFAAHGLEPTGADPLRARTPLQLATTGGDVQLEVAPPPAQGLTAATEWQPTYVVVNGVQLTDKVRILPDAGATQPGHDDKQVLFQSAQALPSPSLPTPGSAITVPIQLKGDLIKGQEFTFADNTTVEIRIPYVTQASDYPFPLDKDKAANYDFQLFAPTTAYDKRGGGMSLAMLNDSYEIEFAVPKGATGRWLLALNNNDLNERTANRIFRARITICQNDVGVVRYPVNGQCVELQAPDLSKLNDANFARTVINGSNTVRVYSAAGFTGNVTKRLNAQGKEVMPLLGFGADTVNWVALKSGTLTIDAVNKKVTTSADARLVMADLSNLSDIHSLPVLRGQFQASAVNNPGKVMALSAPADTYLLLKTPFPDADDNNAQGNKNGWQYTIDMMTDQLIGTGPLQRAVAPTSNANVTTFTAQAQWTVTVLGAPALTGRLLTMSVTPASEFTLGSLLVKAPSALESYALEFDPAALAQADGAADLPEFVQIRLSKGTLAQPASVGGAQLPVQAVILNPGITTSDPANPDPAQRNPVVQCGASCFDLRGPSDQRTATALQIQRRYQMPDMIIQDQANTVIVSAAGQIEVLSSDHPQAGEFANGATGVSFSYETFGASVQTLRKKCPLPNGEGPNVTTVVQGAATMNLPNVASGDGMGITVNFTLCEGSMQSLEFIFESGDALALPLGNSGLWLNRIGGKVTIVPPQPNQQGYTQLTLNMAYRGMTMSASGSQLFSYGQVLIDTRGLVDVQAHTGLDFYGVAVGIDGHFWVAWSPLDLGFDVQACVPTSHDARHPDANALCAGQEFIYGSLKMHMWRGQGWQQAYPWLPDNDDMHATARYQALIQVKAGMIIDAELLVLPPTDASYGVNLAFGEFCRNESCTSYEWGVMGAWVVLDYDIGFYYGFESSLQFILGSADYLLIDEYGQIYSAALPAGAPTALNLQAADAPQTAVIEIQPGAPSALFLVGWSGPPLALYELRDPDGIVVTGGYPGAQFHNSGTPKGEQTMITLQAPKSGKWTVELQKADANTRFQFLYAVNKPRPTLTFAPLPTVNQVNVTTIPLGWASNVTLKDGMRLSLFYHLVEGLEPLTPGKEVRGPIAQYLELDSSGKVDWDVRNLASGVYSVTARLDSSAAVETNRCGAAYNANPFTQKPCNLMFNPNLRLPVTEIVLPGTVTIVDTQAPLPPQDVTVRDEGVSNVVVSWRATDKGVGFRERDLAGYIITCTQGQVPALLVRRLRVAATQPIGSPIKEEGQVNGLYPNQPVVCAVAAYDASRNLSAASPLATATPNSGSLIIPLGAVAQVNVGQPQATVNQFNLSWAAASGAVGYRLYYSIQPTASAGQQAAGALVGMHIQGSGRAVEGASPLDVGNVTAATLTGLKPATTYQAWVRPYDGEGRLGRPSQIIEFTTPALIQQPQTIQFAGVGDQVLGSAPVALTASATSGAPVKFASLTPTVCTVNSTVVTLVTVGLCTLEAIQAGTTHYLAAPAVQQSFTVMADSTLTQRLYLPVAVK